MQKLFNKKETNAVIVVDNPGTNLEGYLDEVDHLLTKKSSSIDLLKAKIYLLRRNLQEQDSLAQQMNFTQYTPPPMPLDNDLDISIEEKSDISGSSIKFFI